MSEENKEPKDENTLKAANSEGDGETKSSPETEAPQETKAEATAGAAQTVSETGSVDAAPAAAQTEAKPAAEEDKEAKAKAAAEARAARAAARAKKTEEEAEAAPKEPSPNQPKLDRLVQILKEHVSEEAVEEAYINEHSDHTPYVVIKNEHWLACANVLKTHEELKLDYLRNLSGTDQESHMEVVYHLVNFEHKQDYGVKVKTDRERPSIASVTPVWATANWNEREAFDLLGIEFPGHPNLKRIMMPDDWVGHPLRKDYEAIDPEV